MSLLAASRGGRCRKYMGGHCMKCLHVAGTEAVHSLVDSSDDASLRSQSVRGLKLDVLPAEEILAFRRGSGKWTHKRSYTVLRYAENSRDQQ